MPENYIALFSAPEKAEAQAILRKALPTLNQGAVWIAEGKPFPEKRVTCLDRLKSGLVNRVFYQFVIRAKFLQHRGLHWLWPLCRALPPE